MKSSTILKVSVFSTALICTKLLLAQTHTEQHGHLGLEFWFSLLEIPFLTLCVVYAFLTASQLKGGKFANGMMFLAWGFIVMAVGHLHMQIDHFFGFNLFNSILGESFGSILWIIALIITWTLSAVGFIRIYKASKGE